LSDVKRTGSRDISELKQRLGLKKGAAPATGPNRVPSGPSGGIAPPPGMSLPSPPGAQPPQPAIPNAADDPFGAMNAMAAVGTVQRAPEIVIVNDGKPVESVGSSSTGAKIATMAIPGVLALVVGVTIGRIGAGASHYNDGLAGARTLLENSKSVKKALTDLERVLDERRADGFRPDAALDKELTGIAARLDIKGDVYAVARNITAEGDLAAQALAFYGGAQEIKGVIDSHLKSAKSDAQAFAAARKASEDKQLKPEQNGYLAGEWRYAVMVTAPATCGEDDKKDCDLPFGAHFVELGPPVCDGKVATGGKCAEGVPPSGFAYRDTPGKETFATGDLVTQGADSIPSKKLLKLVDNGILRGVLQGNEATASEVLYSKRMRTLSDRVKKAITEANKLESALQTQSNKSTRFTFFL
jgi:hypothetical protein